MASTTCLASRAGAFVVAITVVGSVPHLGGLTLRGPHHECVITTVVPLASSRTRSPCSLSQLTPLRWGCTAQSRMGNASSSRRQSSHPRRLISPSHQASRQCRCALRFRYVTNSCRRLGTATSVQLALYSSHMLSWLCVALLSILALVCHGATFHL